MSGDDNANAWLAKTLGRPVKVRAVKETVDDLADKEEFKEVVKQEPVTEKAVTVSEITVTEATAGTETHVDDRVWLSGWVNGCVVNLDKLTMADVPDTALEGMERKVVKLAMLAGLAQLLTQLDEDETLVRSCVGVRENDNIVVLVPLALSSSLDVAAVFTVTDGIYVFSRWIDAGEALEIVANFYPAHPWRR